MKVWIRDTQLYETVQFEEPDVTPEGPDSDWPPYIWTDGTNSCDCTRELFFWRAKGEPESKLIARSEQLLCGDERYLVRLEQEGFRPYDEGVLCIS